MQQSAGQESERQVVQMNLAGKLIIQRKKLGMSQEQLADRLGITRQSVSKWEAGSSMPEISKLIAISELFGVSLDYLLKDYQDEDLCQSRSYGKNTVDENNEENARLEKKVDELARYIRGYEYTSKTRIAGIPLVSIRFSRQLGREGVAKGIIAIGNIAIGVVSLGACSFGIISFGATAIGLLSIGAFAFGLAAWGALAVGVLACGATAVGYYSAGSAAIGKEIAAGVYASGKTAIGETVKGTHCLVYERGITTASQIERFLEETNPHLWKPIKDLLIAFIMYI